MENLRTLWRMRMWKLAQESLAVWSCLTQGRPSQMGEMFPQSCKEGAQG